MYRASFLALSTALALASCDGEADPPDAGGVDAGRTVCDPPLAPLATGDAEGHPEPLSAPPGEARAGRLSAEDLPTDPATRLALYEAGDYVLANDRVALLVEDAGPSDGYDRFGGRPIGIAAVEGGALVRPGDLDELLFVFGAALVETETVTVLADGRDGGPAVLRAAGVAGPLEVLGDLGALLPTGDIEGLPAAVDYTLAPGSDAVDVDLVIQAPDPRGRRLPLVAFGAFQRNRMPLWTEERGFAYDDTSPIAVAAFVSPGRASYALLSPDGAPLEPLLEQAGAIFFDAGRSAVQGCGEQRVPVTSLLLGEPGLEGLQRALARRRGEALRAVEGTARWPDGAPAAGARVHARRADGRHFTRASVDDGGAFRLSVPQGEAVTLTAVAPGFDESAPVAVQAGATRAELVLPARGAIAIAAVAEDGAPLPARVQVTPVAGRTPPAPELGESSPGRGRAHLAFPPDGAVTLAVPVGEHDVVVSHGFEREIVTARVTVLAGETAQVEATLPRVVQSPGVLCADYHIHTRRSPDSPDDPARKLRGLVADGVQIAVRSDHEWIADFEPVIRELGLQEHVLGLGGEELTTFAWGHFGVFPVRPDATQPSGGAFAWAGRLPPETFADVRAHPEAPLLVINHPRSGGALGGYFTAAGFDRDTGAIANPDHWDEDFRVVEVFNESSFEQARDEEVADWFALLRSGRRVFAVGSSDSHRIDGVPVGYPRTCLRLGVDAPRETTPAAVRDATAAGASVISGGVRLSVQGPDGVGPGETARGVGDSAELAVTVQAPSWIEGQLTLEVVVDGASTERVALTEADRDPLNPARRLDGVVTVPVAASGSWVVLHVASDGDLAPVHPGRDAFGVTNPIFLER